MGIGDRKTKSVLHAHHRWPIGAAENGDKPLVLRCEGQPDFCAALYVAWFEGLDCRQSA